MYRMILATSCMMSAMSCLICGEVFVQEFLIGR